MVLLLAAGCDVAIGGDTGERPQSVLDPEGPLAVIQDRAWQILFPAALAVFAAVTATLLFITVRYRARGDTGIPKQIAGSRGAIAIWLAVTVALLGAVKVSTYVAASDGVRFESDNNALEVRVVGKQYWWEFEYTAREALGVRTANELHIPTGQHVALTMESLSAELPDQGAENNSGGALDGVIHSFWVPKLSGKVDVIPGTTRELTLIADEPGVYLGQCAEFCGLSHANMRFRVVAHDPGDFDDWLEAQAEPADPEVEGIATLGQELFETATCIDCHGIRGYETTDGQQADVRIAPDLTHFNSREVFAGGIFDVDDDDQLRAWLENPPEAKPGAQMPALDLTDREIDALIAYLRTLD